MKMTHDELQGLAESVAYTIANVQGAENRACYEYVEGLEDTLDMLGIGIWWDIKKDGVSDDGYICDVVMNGPTDDGNASVTARHCYRVDEHGRVKREKPRTETGSGES